MHFETKESNFPILFERRSCRQKAIDMLPRGTPFDHPKSFLRDAPRFFAMPREVPKRFRVGFPAVPAQLRAKIDFLVWLSWSGRESRERVGDQGDFHLTHRKPGLRPGISWISGMKNQFFKDELVELRIWTVLVNLLNQSKMELVEEPIWLFKHMLQTGAKLFKIN